MQDRKSNLHSIRQYFDASRQSGNCSIVDDISANDLDLDHVYLKIDRTRTSAGQAYLYALLRNQCLDNETFRNRQERIAFFSRNVKTRETVEKHLKKTGFQKAGNLAVELWHYQPVTRRRYLFLVRMWLAVVLAAFVSPVFLGAYALLYFILPVCLITVVIYERTKRRISAHASNLFYLFRLIRCAKSILRTQPENSLPEYAELAGIYRKVKSLQKKVLYFQPFGGFAGDNLSILIEYLKVFFLAELRAFLTSHHRIEKHLPEVRRLYELVGSFDAYISIAQFLDDEDSICPAKCSGTAGEIHAENMVHPLVENCVDNTLTVRKGIIITGTNMSGKSTFLRTIGINQVLATTLCLAFARLYVSGFYTVLTSIVTIDDLNGKRSKYFVEAQRLLQIIQKAKQGKGKYLLLVDEMLSGTNSDDRIQASIAILENITETDSIIISATHDLLIAKSLDGTYGNYHFSEHIEEENLIFDYKLKRGIVDQRNAIRILNYLGFPGEIVSRLRGDNTE